MTTSLLCFAPPKSCFLGRRCEFTKCKFLVLTLILLTWRIWWAPNNASKWQMEFNLAFKGIICCHVIWKGCPVIETFRREFCGILVARAVGAPYFLCQIAGQRRWTLKERVNLSIQRLFAADMTDGMNRLLLTQDRYPDLTSGTWGCFNLLAPELFFLNFSTSYI